MTAAGLIFRLGIRLIFRLVLRLIFGLGDRLIILILTIIAGIFRFRRAVVAENDFILATLGNHDNLIVGGSEGVRTILERGVLGNASSPDDVANIGLKDFLRLTVQLTIGVILMDNRELCRGLGVCSTVVAQNHDVLSTIDNDHLRGSGRGKRVCFLVVGSHLKNALGVNFSILFSGLSHDSDTIHLTIGVILMPDGIRNHCGNNINRAVIANNDSIIAINSQGNGSGRAGGEAVCLFVVGVAAGHAVSVQHSTLGAGRLNYCLAIEFVVGIILMLDGVVHLNRSDLNSAVIAQDDSIFLTIIQRQLRGSAAGILILAILIVQNLDNGILGYHISGSVFLFDSGSAIKYIICVVFVPNSVNNVDVHRRRRRRGRSLDNTVVTQRHGCALRHNHDRGVSRSIPVGFIVVFGNLIQRETVNLSTFLGSLCNSDGAVQFTIGVILMLDVIGNLDRLNVG